MQNHFLFHLLLFSWILSAFREIELINLTLKVNFLQLFCMPPPQHLLMVETNIVLYNNKSLKRVVIPTSTHGPDPKHDKISNKRWIQPPINRFSSFTFKAHSPTQTQSFPTSGFSFSKDFVIEDFPLPNPIIRNGPSQPQNFTFIPTPPPKIFFDDLFLSYKPKKTLLHPQNPSTIRVHPSMGLLS